MISAALRGLALFACAAAFPAQLPAPQPQAAPPKNTGLETDWEIGTVLQDIAAHAAKIGPMLDQIDATAWVQKGAPEAYASQLQSSKDQARILAESAKNVARHPERLSATLEIYFRIQGLETMVATLSEGVRKYQTPAVAQTLVAVAAENGANRDRLQSYIVNLATERERDLQIMDKEAQRCRGMLAEPPSKTGKKK